MSDEPKASKPPRKKRSGSENRRMWPRITFRVDPELDAKIDMDAAAQGFTVGSYLRWLATDHSRIRPTRRALPAEKLLSQLRAEAGHVDGNLAQLLRKANRGEILDIPELATASQAVRDCWKKITDLLYGGS
jgi:hypothetical protein